MSDTNDELQASDRADVDPVPAATYFVQTLGCTAFPVWGSSNGRCFCGDPHDGSRRHGPDNIGKHPATANGFKDATGDLERIRHFLSNPGTPNYGLNPPEGVLVPDVDGPEGLAQWEQLQHRYGPLPITLTTTTANGRHYFYHWPERLGPMPKGKLFGFVARHHDDGYVIGPGSVHPSGVVYDTLRQPSGMPYDIAELPEAWARAALAPVLTVASGGGPSVVAIGQRHDYLRDKARHLVGVGLTGAALFTAVMDLNRQLPESKTEADVHRAIGEAETKFGPDPIGPVSAPAEAWPEPEDRGAAVLSDLGETEYIEDLLRPGRIVVWAAEEGSGKSYTVDDELAIRVAVAGGSFAETWPVLQTGPVLVLSEMHADDDFGREAIVLASLGLDRSALSGRYYRLPLMTAAGGKPALTVPEWRDWITTWLRDHEALLLVVDTATGATQVDPWGGAIQAVYQSLRAMLAAYSALAVVLVVHLKKPQGHGDRRLSDVLGEWGRWNDVTVIMENDGASLGRCKITIRKRVRHERRIIATKRGGLLVEAADADGAKGTKIPLAEVVAAVAGHPGVTLADLGQALGVSKDTAGRYVATLVEAGQVETRPELRPTVKGLRSVTVVYSTADGTAVPPQTTAWASCGGTAAVNVPQIADTAAPPHHRIGAVVSAAEVPPGSVQCSDYHGHYASHVRDGAGWRCLACSGATA